MEKTERQGLFSGFFRLYRPASSCLDELSTAVRFEEKQLGTLLPFLFPEPNSNVGRGALVEKHFFRLESAEGVETWGFCRRAWHNNGACNVSVFLSRHCWPLTFYQLLDWASPYDDEVVVAVLEEILSKELPAPGTSFPLAHVAAPAALRVPRTRYFFGEVNCRPLAEALPPPILSMLVALICLELRFVVYSSSVEKLAAAMHGLLSLLYPLQFQYLCLPVLPAALSSMTMATFPFIIGLHADAQEAVSKLPLEPTVFVDLDKGDLSVPQSHVEQVPSSMVQLLSAALNKCRADHSFGSLGWNMALQDAFVAFFVEMFGGYRQYFVGGKLFDKDAFLLAHPHRSWRPYLAAFCDTQMWTQFLERRRVAPTDDFERQCSYALQNASVFKGMGNYLRNFVDTIGKSGGGGGGGVPATKTLTPTQTPVPTPPVAKKEGPPPVPPRPHLLGKEFGALHSAMAPQSAPSVSARMLLGFDDPEDVLSSSSPAAPALSPAAPTAKPGGDLLSFE